MDERNNNIMLQPSTSGQDLTQGKHAPIGSLRDESGAQKPTLESVRRHATKAAASWNNNDADLRETTLLLEWRDNCRDEIRNEILAEIEGSHGQDLLLNAWAKTFDGATGGELAKLRSTISDGRDDIDCAIEVIRDLLCLAINEGVRFEDAGNIANAPLRAAMRYLDDIGTAVDFIDGWTMTEGGAA